MVWNTECFNELESRVVATMRGLRPVIDVPFYIYLYEPRDELICLREFKDLVARLNARGLSAENVSLSVLMVEALKELGCLEESILLREDENRSVLSRDLERELPKEVTHRLRNNLGGKDVSHCAVLLRRAPCILLSMFQVCCHLLRGLSGAP